MEANTEKLIRELAEKMGTTGEHLWGVLVKQAPITATTHLVMFVITITALALAARYCGREYNKDDDEVTFTMLLLSLSGLVVAVIAALSRASSITAGFLNPEYWALQQLLP